MINLSLLLEDSARNHPDHPALVAGDETWTYADVDTAARRVAALLAERGVGPGDRVALACPNLHWFPILYYGILKAGAVVVPLNVLATEREIAYLLTDSGATAFFCFEGSAPARVAFDQVATCEHLFVIGDDLTATLAALPAGADTVQRAENDPAAILYTSGTTGEPKGAVLTHSNLLLHAVTANRLLASTPCTDRHLVLLPLSHVFAATVNMNAGFASAATLVLAPRFDPRTALRLLAEEEITYLVGVPTVYWALLNAPAVGVDTAAITKNLRRAVSAGSALPVPVIEGFQDRFAVTILEGYGLTETSPTITFTKYGEPARPGSVGVPIWGVDVKLVAEDGRTIDGPDEVGEIAVRGHNVMRGYHNRPAETAEVLRDGWLHTGDLGRRDADGWYSVVDRLKDVVIRGGFNVYPREVEDVLMTHAQVSLAAVVGVPHPSHGEEVKAVVVRKPGATITEAELIEWSRTQLSAYKYPRIVTFVDELPLTATGKPLKRALN